MPSPRKLNPAVHEAVEAVILRSLALKREDRYPTAEAMQDALEEAMRKANLRGSATDLAKFMNGTFAAEEAEQRRLISRASKGELGSAEEAVQVSPVAAAAAAEAASNYAVDNERTLGGSLAAVGRGLGRNWKAEADEVDYDSQEDIKTRVHGNDAVTSEPPSSQSTTEPRGVEALRGQQYRDDRLCAGGAGGRVDRDDRVADRALAC